MSRRERQVFACVAHQPHAGAEFPSPALGGETDFLNSPLHEAGRALHPRYIPTSALLPVSQTQLLKTRVAADTHHLHLHLSLIQTYAPGSSSSHPIPSWRPASGSITSGSISPANSCIAISMSSPRDLILSSDMIRRRGTPPGGGAISRTSRPSYCVTPGYWRCRAMTVHFTPQRGDGGAHNFDDRI